jgi:hypothetical protein
MHCQTEMQIFLNNELWGSNFALKSNDVTNIVHRYFHIYINYIAKKNHIEFVTSSPGFHYFYIQGTCFQKLLGEMCKILF